MRDLYAGHPARVATVECAPGAQHQIVWDRGTLVLAAHDVDAERALRGLGGDVPMCLEIFDAYRRALGDPDALTVACASTGAAGDLLALRDEVRSPARVVWSGFTAGTPSASVSVAVRKAREALSHRWRNTLISNLPAPLKAGFVVDSVAAMVSAWETGAPQRSFEFDELLRSQVTNKLSASMRSWVTRTVRDASTWCQARLAEPGIEHPTLTSWPSQVSVVVPLRWFADVWARGIFGSIEECFVLDVTEVRAPHELVVRAIRWQSNGSFAEPLVVPAVARLADGRWRLTIEEHP